MNENKTGRLSAEKETGLISVGEIINTHGVRGEVRVLPLTDFPERFKAGSILLFEKNGRLARLSIDSVRPYKNMFLIKFREIADMTSAEKIKGGLLKVRLDELPELPEDTYFVFDIIDMEVQTEDGMRLGPVKNVIRTGSSDIYVVAGTQKDYMIPAVKEIVKQIDKSNRRITIKPLDGLLDL